MQDTMWDIFISHASEDKDELARPLATKLAEYGAKIWIDENELKMGDSLRKKIDTGISHSKYGVVIFSPNFFSKKWTSDELSALLGNETLYHKVILPIWHNVTKEDVQHYSPLLADRFAIKSSVGIEAMVDEIFNVLLLEKSQKDNGGNKVNSKKSTHEDFEYFIEHDLDFLKIHHRFSELAYKTAPEAYIKTPSFDKLNIIFTFKENPELKRSIVLLGEKGAGKTSTLNFWLTEYNDKLYENKIIWIRLDTHKLFNLWLNGVTPNKDDKSTSIDSNIFKHSLLPSIEDYNSVHFLYVFAKYFHESFSKLASLLEEKRPRFNFPMSRRDEGIMEEKDLLSYIKSLRETIIKEECNQRDSFGLNVLQRSLNSGGREKRRWVSCSIALQNFLKDQGYCFLNILDSAENLLLTTEYGAESHYEKISQNLMFRMYTNIFSYLHDKKSNSHIVLAAMDDRTYTSAIANHPFVLNNFEHKDSFVISHSHPCFKTVLKKLFDFAKFNFLNTNNLYAKCVEEVIRETTDINEERYRNNIRSFLNDKLSSIEMKYLNQIKSAK